MAHVHQGTACVGEVQASGGRAWEYSSTDHSFTICTCLFVCVCCCACVVCVLTWCVVSTKTTTTQGVLAAQRKKERRSAQRRKARDDGAGEAAGAAEATAVTTEVLMGTIQNARPTESSSLESKVDVMVETKACESPRAPVGEQRGNASRPYSRPADPSTAATNRRSAARSATRPTTRPTVRSPASAPPRTVKAVPRSYGRGTGDIRSLEALLNGRFDRLCDVSSQGRPNVWPAIPISWPHAT